MIMLFVLLLTNCCFCNRLSINLQKRLFLGLPTELRKVECESPECHFVLNTLKGIKHDMHDISFSRAFENGWPVASLLIAVYGLKGEVFDESLSLHILTERSTSGCQKATAIVSLAVDRLPVMKSNFSFSIALAEKIIRDESELSLEVLLSCADFLRSVSALEAAAFYSRVDSNEFYVSDDHNATIYANHMNEDNRAESRSHCVIDSAETSSGGCNVFAGMFVGMRYWLERGITRENIRQAFKSTTDQKFVLLSKVGDFFEIQVPRSGHFKGHLNSELSCVVEFVLKVLSKGLDIPDFELVLNNGDLPLARKSPGKPPFYDFSDFHSTIPIPLFSLAGSDDFYDLVFPNVCRPKLVSLSSKYEWHDKEEKMFWRGTDRGAINWSEKSEPFSQMRSLRKRFEDDLKQTSEDYCDFAILADDLVNATVVFRDPKFVPMEESLKYKYILDIPGNGYSGSLKQKLTSNSLVFAVFKPHLFPQHKAVYEHFYFGLKKDFHLVEIDKPSDIELNLSQANDAKMKSIADNANAFMKSFDILSECYLWKQLKVYSSALNYGINHFEYNDTVVFRRLIKSESTNEGEQFIKNCNNLISEQAM